MKRHFKIDYILSIVLVCFFIISLLAINSAEIIINDNTLVLKQLVWYIIGLVLIFIIIKLKNSFIYKNIWIFYIILNILLLGLLLFAKPINGVAAWYHIPGGTIQPSEFMKIILILVIGVVINRFYNLTSSPTFKDELLLIFKIGLILLIPSILTFLQPDTGVVMIYFIIALVMLFTSGLRYRWFLIFGGFLTIILVTILVTYFINTELFIDIFGTDFFLRVDRLLDWSNQSGYQLENGITAIGSSSLFGFGLNNTPIYFPEAQTDFIFAVIASNVGLIGSLIVFILLVIFDLRLIYIANKTNILLNKIILSGLIGMLMYQQFQNIGMTYGVLPITGITLPFISYGGSSLLSYMIMIGIVFNIINEKNNKHVL